MESASKKRKIREEEEPNAQQPASSGSSLSELKLTDLKIASHEPLKNLPRAVCKQCNKKRKYFCYDCLIPMCAPEAVPKVELPILCEIVHFPAEATSKSTAIHARMVAPTTSHMYEFPDLPDFSPEDTVLLYPSPDAKAISELDITKVKRVVFIDSQWNRTNRMLHDERIAALPRVKITAYKTHFWRYQSEGPDCLSTIEAIYHFYREYHERLHAGNYEGEYDNLLWYFSFFYGLIQDHYKKTQKEFPRIEGYVNLETSEADKAK